MALPPIPPIPPPPTLSPPPPISPVFEDNIDVLIQDLLKNKSGQVVDYNTLAQRAKNDESIVFEILDKIKYFNANIIPSSGGNIDLDFGTFLLPNAYMDCGTIIPVAP